MYTLIRWFLFKLNPESAQHFTFNLLKILFKIPGAAWLSKKMFAVNNNNLGVDVFGLHFPNRVGLAAGFDKDAKYQLGDLKKDSFKEIWHNQNYQQFRSQILKGRDQIDICKNCTEGCKVWEKI